MTACNLDNSFLRLVTSDSMPVDCGVERSRIVGDAEIRIDVFPPTGARASAGTAAGYDSDGRGRYAAGGRRKAHGSANQIHATT
jgi:hypothetical protein